MTIQCSAERKLFWMMAVCACLFGCVWNPASRLNQESTTAIPLSGYASSPGDTITFKATNLTTGAVYTFPQVAIASQTPTITSGGYNLYGWSISLTPPADFWAPQQAWNGLTQSAGRLELTALEGGYPLDTFSVTAQQCVINSLSQGNSVPAAGAACTDGTTVVVFDNNGVGNGAESTGWTIDYGPYNDNLYGDVATWEIGHYKVQQKTIYGVMCHPSANYSAPHKAAIINHGGFAGITDFYVSLCLLGAHSGWVTAESAYRGEWVSAHVPAGAGTTLITTPLSGGNVELCLGEVTDSLRMIDIVRARADVDTSRVVTWGYSHGGCVTQKAVEHGAVVAAAAAFSGPTDFQNWSITNGNPTQDSAARWARESPTTPIWTRSTPRSVTPRPGPPWPAPPRPTPGVRRRYMRPIWRRWPPRCHSSSCRAPQTRPSPPIRHASSHTTPGGLRPRRGTSTSTEILRAARRRAPAPSRRAR